MYEMCGRPITKNTILFLKWLNWLKLKFNFGILKYYDFFVCFKFAVLMFSLQIKNYVVRSKFDHLVTEMWF